MAINNKTLGAISLFGMVLAISFAISFKLSLTNRSLAPNAPESNPYAAGTCKEECPGADNVLRNCTPPEPDGGSTDSLCNAKGRIESCGGKDYCCSKPGAKWTTNMKSCCKVTKWTPAANTVCKGVALTQKSNCGTTRKVKGTKDCGCTPTTWTPDVSTKCLNVSFVQTSDCSSTRSATGTKTDGSCATCVDTTWTPAANTVCVGTKLTQTSNCGKEREVDGTKVCACVPTTWTPETNTVCAGTNLTQTSNCGTTKVVAGTKVCCTDTTWTPSKTNICIEDTFTQTSNCGNEREVNGTKVCYPDLSITTRVYQDDPRNKPGEYFIDKKISKAARDQYMVYTMEVKNSGTGTAKNFKITDTLTGQNQNMITFVDTEDSCSYDYPSKKLTCEIEELAAKGIINPKFRVKIAQTALNGKIIRNTARVAYSGKTRESSTDTLVSTIVSCNELCTNDSECVAGLACDVFSNKCRRATCSKDTTCSCITPTATVTSRPTATLTATITPTDSEIEFPDSSLTTPTEEILAENEDFLPETGIFDFPQTAVFGGGLLLAILGLFLAL